MFQFLQTSPFRFLMLWSSEILSNAYRLLHTINSIGIFPPQLTASVEMEQWLVHFSLGEGEEADQEEEGACLVLCNI